MAKDVRVVEDDGTQLGVLSLEDALQRAAEKGLDLVEVAPNAVPPVCKIMDYGKYLFQLQKKQQEAKKKQVSIQLKEIKFRPKTDEHDFQTKLNHIRRFLGSGDKCKVSVFFRGREMVHKEQGLELLQRVAAGLEELGKVEQEPKAEGRTVHMVVASLVKKK